VLAVSKHLMLSAHRDGTGVVIANKQQHVTEVTAAWLSFRAVLTLQFPGC